MERPIEMPHIIAHIPAREGSKRVALKNLRLLNGKPLIQYSIETARSSKLLTDFFVNTESPLIQQFAESMKASVYLRAKELAEDDVTQDAFNYDFVRKHPCDIFVLINPVCPLVTAADLDDALEKFIRGKYDSLISVTKTQLHTFMDGHAVNFNPNERLPTTQSLSPMMVCNWAINIWRRSAFLEEYETKGHAVFFGKVALHEIPQKKAVKISTEEDFELAGLLLKSRPYEEA